jgi:hypothetical protein
MMLHECPNHGGRTFWAQRQRTTTAIFEDVHLLTGDITLFANAPIKNGYIFEHGS